MLRRLVMAEATIFHPTVPNPLMPPPPAALQVVLHALVGGRDAAGVAFLESQLCIRLARIAQNSVYWLAKSVVGGGQGRVWQAFQMGACIPRELGLLTGLTGELLNAALGGLQPAPCPRISFNEVSLHRYPVGGYGITPHRDHRRYRYLVAVIILAGRGRFIVCADRAGRGAREVPAPAGTLLLMRAPGFAGSDRRPFHAVLDIVVPRLTLMLRYDSEKKSAL